MTPNHSMQGTASQRASASCEAAADRNRQSDQKTLPNVPRANLVPLEVHVDSHSSGGTRKS